MEANGGDASWINSKNERHNRSIHNMVREGLLDSNQHAKKWCCAAEKLAEVHICKTHDALDDTPPHFAWYGKNPIIHQLRKFGCDI